MKTTETSGKTITTAPTMPGHKPDVQRPQLPPLEEQQQAASRGHRLESLPLGAAGDQYEQEADQAAEQVVQRLESGTGQTGAIQATPTPGPAVQAKGEGTGSGASAAALTQLPLAPGNGRALEPAARAPMERAFGVSLGDVRLHTDRPARQLNDALSARAITVGPHIYFDQDEYRPASAAGRALLAHELTHVLQQRRGGRRLQRRGRNQGHLPDELARRLRQADLDQARAHIQPAGPAAVAAPAFSQGDPIHFANPGSEQHLPHEAWHVVQQRQGRNPPSPVGRHGHTSANATANVTNAGSPGTPAAAASPCNCDEADNGGANASQRPTQATGPDRGQDNLPEFGGYQLLEHDPNAIGAYQMVDDRQAAGPSREQDDLPEFGGYQLLEHDPNAIGAYQVVDDRRATGPTRDQDDLPELGGYQLLEHDPNAISAYQMVDDRRAAGPSREQDDLPEFGGYQLLEHDPNAIGAYQRWDDKNRNR